MPENQVLLAGDNVGNNTPMDEVLNRIEALTNIGAALSSEQNIDHLLELILLAAKKLLNADGGTIYRVRENDVTFEIVVRRIS